MSQGRFVICEPTVPERTVPDSAVVDASNHTASDFRGMEEESPHRDSHLFALSPHKLVGSTYTSPML